jgi:glucose-1-phosphate cytidylyltransferase
MRDYADNIPKPLVTVGGRPILWHIMKYYAYWGHRDFILCLGHRSDAIKEYFLRYNEALTNDFVLDRGKQHLDLLQTDLSTWTITFVETGVEASVGERLSAVRDYLDGEEIFLANYADGLSDLPLPKVIDRFRKSDAIASFLSVRPNLSYHFVTARDSDGIVTDLRDVESQDIRVNGGYFVLRSSIFDYIRPKEDLVGEPFRRLIEKKALMAYRYDGFWVAMDTFKDRMYLEDLAARGNPPWTVWKQPPKAP